jgi:hypothetical protein
MVGEIIRYGARHHIGMPGRHHRNPHCERAAASKSGGDHANRDACHNRNARRVRCVSRCCGHETPLAGGKRPSNMHSAEIGMPVARLRLGSLCLRVQFPGRRVGSARAVLQEPLQLCMGTMHEDRILGGGSSTPPSRTPLSLDPMWSGRSPTKRRKRTRGDEHEEVDNCRTGTVRNICGIRGKGPRIRRPCLVYHPRHQEI